MNITKKKESSILLIHGWGMTANFWAALDTALPNTHTTNVIDMGFTDPSKKFDNIHNIERPDYVIAHSLGGLYALHHNIKPNYGIIFINSFYHFSDFNDPNSLSLMQKSLSKNCNAQMKRFLKQSDCLAYSDKTSSWNIENLNMGLEALKQWSHKETLGKWNNDNISILTLAGALDKICPIEKTKLHWDGFPLYIQEEAGHALPNSHINWCKNHIESFIKSHEYVKKSK